jgi:murein DD-endopeptidase MepM/ murein hydrolase activator NlpD
MRIIVAGTLVFLATLFSCNNPEHEIGFLPIIEETDTVAPEVEYGFILDSFIVHRKTVEANQTLSHILAPYGISQALINTAYYIAKDSAKLNYVTEGANYLMLCKNDSAQTLQYFIYDKNAFEFIVFDFVDSLRVVRNERELTIDTVALSIAIEKGSSLSKELQSRAQSINLTNELVEQIAGVYAYSIDFFKLQPSDECRVIFELKSIEGKPYSMGKIIAMEFVHRGKDFYAFPYTVNGKLAYYDDNGKSMKRLFIQAPIKYVRISSGYTQQRFHPVQQRWKAHLGTDYAAPTGTPIWATADGVVEQAGFTKFNGNYVKIRHNKTYQTGYLHMSKIENGIKSGVYVKQGQIIGYVGSTGLATGPHVCYRFWKNGQQIDHRRETFEATEPIAEKELPEYLKYMKPLKAKLDSLSLEAEGIIAL